jgi:hypothetical protein
MQYDDELPKMKAAVEEYIYQQKGVRVNIVINNPFMVRIHCQMLAYAYSYVLQKTRK